MRPAKAVLLVHGDPDALGILSLVLSTRGYRVAAVASAGLALRELALGPFDALAAELSVARQPFAELAAHHARRSDNQNFHDLSPFFRT